MSAILHCIITEIENSRITYNIKNWWRNTKINIIIDRYSGQINEIKDIIYDIESKGNGPCLKELKLKVWNLCGEGSTHECHCHIDKQEWYKEIKIKLSCEFIFECIQYIDGVTYDLEMQNYQLSEIGNPNNLKRIVISLMVKQKRSINELKNELLELEAEMEAEIKEIIN
jgi:hypothetical protein